MCTVVILRRPGHPWPLLLAANRDERIERAWDPPAAHWPEHPGLVAGRDRSAGGTWMGLRGGVVAGVLNRPGSLGPAPGKRSRGELPLLALEATSASEAASRIAALEAAAWRPFNMVVADAAQAFFLRGLGTGRPEALPLPEGVSMVTAHEPNDLSSPRIARHLPRFRAATPPDPARDEWGGWEAMLSDADTAEGLGAALNVPPVDGFGTVCSTMLALGAGRVWRFCAGRPQPGRFFPLPLEAA